MIRASRVTWNEYGDPKVTVTIEGHTDLYRFAYNMERLQSDHAQIGFALMRKMRRRWGARKFAALERSMHGGSAK
jgi:hypothetical protein